MIDYKFREGELLAEVKKYIDATYDEHYATGKIQATESIIDDGHGTGFCMGNVGKYGRRYGKKGETPAEWRKDLMKVMHYTIIQLFIHDKEHAVSREDAYREIGAADLDHAPIRKHPDWEAKTRLNDAFVAGTWEPDIRLNDATPDDWDRLRNSNKESGN